MIHLFNHHNITKTNYCNAISEKKKLTEKCVEYENVSINVRLIIHPTDTGMMMMMMMKRKFV